LSLGPRNALAPPVSVSPAAEGTKLSLPHIEAPIDDGEITVGVMKPVGGVAVATDGHNALAMLRRRNGETLIELPVRLDEAVGQALADDDYIDEINTSAPPRRHR